MKMRIYNLLVNRRIGISQRYHKVHDNSHGVMKLLSWGYLLWLNFAYYILFCRFLGKAKQVEIYENKRLVVGQSESQSFKNEFKDDVDSLVSKLAAYEYISFDVFDTLIFRPFSEPTDLFYLLGEKLGFMDFKRIRMESEARSRHICFQKKGHYEVTLDDAWDVLSKETGIDKKYGMNLEIELEKKLCYANPFMKEVFDKLLVMGKHIIIISDMYLPKRVLKDILAKNGYTGYGKLYVSCEYGENKASGTLYARAKKEYGLGRKNLKDIWIHVGDNAHSDVFRAKQAGMSAYHYPNVNKNTCMFRPYDMSPVIGGAYRGIVNNTIYSGLKSYSPEYEYGYIYGGLFVLGYCNFIHDYCRKNSVDKVLFLSRDGDILKQVYDNLYPEEKTEYIYWSRRAATKLMADYNRYDYFRRFGYHKVNSGITIEKALKGMELDKLCEKLPKSLKPKDKLTQRNAVAFKKFIERNWKQVQKLYKLENEGAYCYFDEKLKDCKKVCAVDIGWAGSGAISISHLVEKVWNFDCEVVGMIAGTNTVYNAEYDASETFLQSGKLVSYLYSLANNRDLMKKHDLNKDYNIYWELLLQSPTRQFKGFSYDKELQQPILLYGEEDVNQEGILDIQQGIKDFVEEYQKHFKDFDYMYYVSGRDAYAPMLVAASYKERYLKFINERFQLEINIS